MSNLHRFATAALIPLLASCAGHVDRRAIVHDEQVFGTWTTSTGARFTLKADRTFTSQGLHLDPSLAEGCPSGEARGDWGFYVDAGKPGDLSIVSTTARSGDTIGVTFNEIPQGDCIISLTFLENQKFCISVDPDEVCTFSDRFTRISPEVKE
ncbi:hypothetical protein [Streptomyces sp. NRRL S-87]|uniref:hypothetical protein n=1 Tax=Streptomyces sp. NRRL S-87 TaxID=1463920 RepID=UPI00131BC576|nr:hypothetical protein [Streptomyces sp. NRRL S-87]